jgi:hypothetical protein
MTSTEFIKWVRYLEWRDVEEFRREDFYLAQIAAQVERGYVKHPSQVTLQKKLLKFTTQGEPSKGAGSHVQTSKAFWMALTGARRGAGSQQNDAPRQDGLDTQDPKRKRQGRGKGMRRTR